ncbi:MAG: hypothetical protein IJ565_05655 [Bacilli bacterium]|nr:hypothetical protein [Bacilli bacterium]
MTLEEFNKNRMQNIEECKDKIMKDFKNLSINDQLLYDFTNDCGSTKYINNDSYIDKYFIYKARLCSTSSQDQEYVKKIKNDLLYNTVGDPDSNSILLQQIYDKLWSKADSKSYMINGTNNYFYSDTLTSFSTSLSYMMNYYYNHRFTCGKGSENYTVNKCFNEYDKNSRNVLDVFKNSPYLYAFLKLYHTIGNFMPVPKDFNTSRSHYGVEDYFHLTLSKMKNNEYEKLLGSKKELIKNTKDWFDENFIEDNFLKDYDDNLKDLLELLPWDLKKRDYDKYNDFLKLQCEIILSRGISMLKKLHYDNEEKLKELDDIKINDLLEELSK